MIGPRQSGRTTAICQAAKALDATVVCADQSQAEYVRKTHGVKAVSVDRKTAWQGSIGPFLFDHHAVERLVHDYAMCAAELAELRLRIDGLEK